jgi:CRP-like cAMP-binding protein
MDVASLGKISNLLEALDAPARHKLLSLARRAHVAAGTAVFREGDHGLDFFVVAKGSARVTVDDLGQEREVGRLAHGDFFGEMAALNNGLRTATVTAIEDLDLVAFPGDEVEALVADYPAAREALHRAGLVRAEATLARLSE